jgi:mRNA-degrading endonuclease RelE of RelBE toxin-antitoxin system
MGQKQLPKYRLIFHRKAEKSLAALDEKMKRQLLEDIGSIENFAGF